MPIEESKEERLHELQHELKGNLLLKRNLEVSLSKVNSKIEAIERELKELQEQCH